MHARRDTLPQRLQNAVYHPIRRVTPSVIDRLAGEIRTAPDGANQMPPVMRGEASELSAKPKVSYPA